MKRGLILPGRNAREDVALAQRAEKSGFDGVFVVEFFHRNAYARLGALTQATRSILIGSGIANTFTRSPMVTAAAALDLDEMSQGRLVLGLGTGLQRMNEEWYGVPFGDKPASRARELIGLLREVWAHEGLGFEHRGDFYDIAIQAYRRPDVVRTDIPIWLAAVNRGMIRSAGTVADGMVGHPVHTRTWHREVSLPILREAAEAAGRAHDACPIFPYVITAIRETRKEAVEAAKRQIGFSFSVEHYHSILRLHGLEDVGKACRAALPTFDIEAMARAIPDELVDEIAIACTPDEAKDRLEQWRDITPMPLLYPASAEVASEAFESHIHHVFECFGST